MSSVYQPSFRTTVLCIFHLTNIIVIVGSPSNNVRENSKRFFRPVAAHVPPYDIVTTSRNGTQSYGRSSSAYVVEWMAVKLNFAFEYVYVSAEQAKERGNEAAFDLLASEAADFTATAFAITPVRYPKLELATFPNWEEGYRMVVPRPGEQDRLFAFIKPFDVKVWILLGVSFIIVSFFMGLLTWASVRYANGKPNGELIKTNDARLADTIGTYFLYNVNVLTNHGDYLKSLNISFLVGVSAWLLGASVLVYGYSSIVVSFITLPQMMQSINSFEDVVVHPDVSLIIRTDTYIGNAINSTSDIPLYKALREKALRRPGSIGNEGVINSTQLLLTGKYAYVFLDTAVRFFVANQYVREGKCTFKQSNRLLLSNSYFYQFFSKNNKHLTREFTIASIHLWETGLLRFVVKTLPWLPKAEPCFANSDTARKSTKQTSIKLMDLISAFFILGVGAALSCLVFLIELAVSFRGKRRMHK